MRGGFEMTQEYDSMYEALKRAASDHESCGLRVPMSISTPSEYLTQQDILLRCQDAGFFG